MTARQHLVWRVDGHLAPMLPTMAGLEVLRLEWVVYPLWGGAPLVRRRRLTLPAMALREFSEASRIWALEFAGGAWLRVFFFQLVGQTVTDTTAWIPFVIWTSLKI